MKREFLLPIVIGLAVLLLSGCTKSPPITEPVIQEQVFQADFDVTWHAIIDALSDGNYPIQSIEKESGLVTTQFVVFTQGIGAKSQIDRIAAVPGMFLGTWSAGRYSLSIFATSITGGTRVRIKAHVEAYENNVSYTWHVCQSRGVLEGSILNVIGTKLAE